VKTTVGNLTQKCHCLSPCPHQSWLGWSNNHGGHLVQIRKGLVIF